MDICDEEQQDSPSLVRFNSHPTLDLKKQQCTEGSVAFEQLYQGYAPTVKLAILFRLLKAEAKKDIKLSEDATGEGLALTYSHCYSRTLKSCLVGEARLGDVLIVVSCHCCTWSLLIDVCLHMIDGVDVLLVLM